MFTLTSDIRRTVRKMKEQVENASASDQVERLVMPILVRYPTKQRKYISECVYQHVSKDAVLEPVKIIRFPCGTGAAAKRYFYQGYFIAPPDAEFARDGVIRENINRKRNPKFNPKKLIFVNDVWTA